VVALSDAFYVAIYDVNDSISDFYADIVDNYVLKLSVSIVFLRCVLIVTIE
jgi:hypothetical protein